MPLSRGSKRLGPSLRVDGVGRVVKVVTGKGGKDGCWHQLRRGLSESGSVINQPPSHRTAKSEIRMLKLKR